MSKGSSKNRPKKGAKTRKKVQSKLSKVLGSSRSTLQARGKFFNELSPGEIRTNVARLHDHRAFTEVIDLPKHSSFDSFYSLKIPNTSFEKSLSWCVGIIGAHREKISEQIECEKFITKAILSSEWDQALALLDESTKKMGVSNWSNKIRAGVHKTLDVTESSEDKERSEGRSLARYIAKNCMMYGESQEIFFNSSKSLKRDINRHAGPQIKDVLLYQLFSIDTKKNYDFERLLNDEKRTSLSDIFHVVKDYYYVNPFSGNNYYHRSNLKYLVGSFRDLPEDLKSIALVNGIISCANVNSKEAQIYDTFFEGKYDKITRTIGNDVFSLSFSSFLTLARAYAQTGKTMLTGLGLDIANSIKHIILRDNEFYEAKQHLSFNAYKFRGLDWFRDLENYLRIVDNFPSTSYQRKVQLQVGLSSTYPTHETIDCASSEVRDTKIAELKAGIPKPTAIEIRDYIFSKSKVRLQRIDQTRKLYYEALKKLLEGNLTFSAKALSQIQKLDDLTLKYVAFYNYLDCLIKKDAIDDAVSAYVSMYFTQKNVCFGYDISKLITSFSERIADSRNIDYCIVLSIYSLLKSSKYDPLLKFSFESFLINNNVRYPKDLYGMEGAFGEHRLGYFFRNVCTKKNMSLYLEFTSAKEVEDCRLSICHYLMSSGDSSDSLKGEVKEIQKSRLVKKAEKRVDNSRIYVDTTTLLGRQSSQYKDLFESFLKEKDEYDEIDEGSLRTLYETIKLASKNNDTDLFEMLTLLYPAELNWNRKDLILLSLVKLVRDEFTHGERGLNNHLSTRIRHGVLPTKIRDVFHSEHLYLAKDVKFKDFYSRSKWASGVYALPDPSKSDMYDILRSFSERIESIISIINDQWIQIYTLDQHVGDLSKENKGMFNFSVSPLEIYALRNMLPASPTYNDFIELCLRWLWIRTDINLCKIREKIQDEGKRLVFDSIEHFMKEAKSILPKGSSLDELSNASLRVKDEMSVRFDLISSWFSRNMDESDEYYDFQTAIEVARSTIDVPVAINSQDLQLTARAFGYVVDILLILFENAVSKSGLNRSKLDLSIDARRSEEEGLEITVANRCSELSVDENSILFYKEAYGDESLSNDVAHSEGGTGFFKVWKILKKDLGISHSFDIKFEEEYFVVNIKMESSGHVKWH